MMNRALEDQRRRTNPTRTRASGARWTFLTAASVLLLVATAVWAMRRSTARVVVVRDFAPHLEGSDGHAGRCTVGKGNAPAFQHGWHVGRLLRYSFRTVAQVLSAQGKIGGPQEDAALEPVVRVEFSGRLAVRVYAALGDDFLIGYRVEQVRAQAGGELSQGQKDEMETVLRQGEILACVTSRGAISDLREAPATSKPAHGLLLALVSSLRVTLPATQTAEWQADEEDPLGPYLARYRSFPAEDAPSLLVHKQKEYRARVTETSRCDTLGNGTARFDPCRGGLVEVTDCMTRRQRPPQTPVEIEERLTTSITLAEVSNTGIAASEVAEKTAAMDTWAKIDSLEMRGPAGGPGDVAMNRHTYPDLSLNEALERMNEALSHGEWEKKGCAVLPSLVQLFRRDARSVDSVRARLSVPGDLPIEVARALTVALGQAGTSEAQQALVDVGATPGLAEELRDAAVFAACWVVDPTRQTADSLEVISEGNDRLSLKVLEGLGTVALHSAGTDDALSLRIVSFLESRLSSDPSERGQVAALRGLGNAGREASVDVISPFLSRGSEEVRSAAVLALRNIPSSVAESKIQERLNEDDSPQVRRAAAIALAMRGDDGSQRSLERVLREEKDSSVRLEAVRAIAQSETLPKAARESLLSLSASVDPSDIVRQAASSVVRTQANR